MKKLMNKKGFTLMEMLIVVAIIVILVAISIPVFTSQLTKAKKATDDANERAAKGMATTMYLAGDFTFNEDGDDLVYLYDATNGKLVATSESVKGYSQATDDKVIKVTITEDGDVSLAWDTETDTAE